MSGDDVDFVVGPAGDEELPAPPTRAEFWRRGVIVAAAIAVLGALVGVRLATSHPRTSAALLPSPTPTSSPSDLPLLSAGPTGVVVYVVPTPGVPEGTSFTIPDPPAKSCPTDATCTVWPTAPDAVARAVRAAFPGAVLHSAASELVRRSGSVGTDLLARKLVATVGDLRITVAIVKEGVDSAAAPAELGVVAVDAHVSGYEVTVRVRSSRGFAHVQPRTVRGLAVDARLLVAR